jgi:hypothetical protein
MREDISVFLKLEDGRPPHYFGRNVDVHAGNQYKA